MSGPHAPLTFGRYEALFHIASGGMAEVFAARLRGPHGFEKLVAIKRLLPDLADDHFVQMFQDEARLAANITSPHVVQTMELGRHEEDGALYIVMELVVGVTLYELCVSVLDSTIAMLPIPLVAEALAQASRGLDDAHNATTPTGQPLHVVHRDVSPQNLLCGVDGRIRVTDFGIARAVSRSTKTQVGQLKGKVAYLSPEQSRGEGLDARSDVFALGVVTWEALTGRSLFNTGDAMETVRRVRDLPIPSPRELRSDVPKKLVDVVMWALERKVDRRCPSAARYARALREAVPERPSQRKLAAFVQQHGGTQLQRMQDKLQEVNQQPRERTMMIRMQRMGSRLVPLAQPTGERSRVFGLDKQLPSDAPPAEAKPKKARTDPTPVIDPGRKKDIRPPPKKQRDLSTALMPDGEPLDPSAGDARALAPADRRARGRALAFVALGLGAWLLAAVLLYFALRSKPERQQDILPRTQQPE